MSTFLDDPETLELADQHAFNLAVWGKLLEDELLRELPHRVETNEFGQAVISPLPILEHGEWQTKVSFLLHELMPSGTVSIICPVSTSRGVKGVDVVWSSRTRWEPQRGQVCPTHAPELCIEIAARNDSRRELKEKKRLYFEAGAEEVWFRERDGRMAFHQKDAPDVAVECSALCPAFPVRVD